MRRLRNVEHLLRFGVLAGVVLLLFTPFVVTTGTIFPFVVGKALWARTIIEIVFALWVALALTNPTYRPPRTWMLVLLAAGLAVSLLASLFGASLQRSLWSNYERMQGTIDLAHWFALAVILGSVLRSAARHGRRCSSSTPAPARRWRAWSSPATTRLTCPSTRRCPSLTPREWVDRSAIRPI